LTSKKPRVELQGRAGLIYYEGNRRIKVDSELLAGPQFDIVIYSDSLKAWEPPFDEESLTPQDIERIKFNINSELKKMRIDWQ
jgi:hypothetical protein